ncbi:MAG: hypothetical protein ABSH46_21735 [Bryobacteraceae bacterium]|jgi:hypothetical protein
MSAWPDNQNPSLRGTEGELVSVRITVEPRTLERLLDLLAELSFPINPQLYHDAAVVYVGPDGGRHLEPATIIEFPAWAGRVREIEAALTGAGFDGASLSVKDMLADIHSPAAEETAPAGARYKAIVRWQHPLRAIA